MVCCSSTKCEPFAVAVSFASTTLMSLMASHAGTCEYLNLTKDQNFALCVTLATLSAFMGSLILARSIARLGK